MGEQTWEASGLGAPDDIDQLDQRITALTAEVADLRIRLNERTDELHAARLANRELMARLNLPPPTGWPAETMQHRCGPRRSPVHTGPTSRSATSTLLAHPRYPKRTGCVPTSAPSATSTTRRSSTTTPPTKQDNQPGNQTNALSHSLPRLQSCPHSPRTAGLRTPPEPGSRDRHTLRGLRCDSSCWASSLDVREPGLSPGKGLGLASSL